MALQSRGFEVTNIPRAQGVDFSLQPGQFTAGLNSGIGAFNAFNNIAEEVRDRPLRNRERVSRLAQIESEAQLAPVRRQLTEIQLAKAGLPEAVTTGSTVIRVPRADAPDQYDLVEQIDGFTFDPKTNQSTPFKRAGKLIQSSEDMANEKALRDFQRAQSNATLEKIASEKAYRNELLKLKERQQNAKEEDLDLERAENLKKAQNAGLRYTEGERNGLKIGMYVHPTQGIINEIPLGVKPIRSVNPLEALLAPANPDSGDRGNPAPAPAKVAPKQSRPSIGISVLDRFDENGNEIEINQEVVGVESPLPVFSVPPVSNSNGKYRILPR